MPNRTPDEVRWIVVHQHEILGYDNYTIAKNNMLTEATVRNILSLWKSTSKVRTPIPPGVLGRPRRFDFESSLYLHERIAQTPNLYLDEIQEDVHHALNLDVHFSTISRTLKRDGITRKKCHREASERSDEHRHNYRSVTSVIPPSYLVFCDECSIDRRGVERDHGYSLHGERIHVDTPFVRGNRVSFLPGMSEDGILALEVVEGSFTADTFRDFVAKVLDKMNPYRQGIQSWLWITVASTKTQRLLK
ncbi:DDE superfamily endonuclease [Ceratobasidium sp. AG-Ba]|nr:DDE superfamily endonuclease [Ceratobasidium sp. AG-Ba]